MNSKHPDKKWPWLAAITTLWGLSACEAPTATGPDTETEVQAPVDVGVDVVDVLLDVLDSATDDLVVPVDGVECGGNTGCLCSADADCVSGFCAEVPDGKRCTSLCSTECPAGTTCQSDSPGGTTYCAPVGVRQCAPCQTDTDCVGQHGAPARCIDAGLDGWFCAVTCENAADCPANTTCLDAPGGKACQPALGLASCSCSPWASGAQASATCGVAKADQICSGARSCGATGLSACTLAADPTCVDAVCYQQADATPCDDGNSCSTGTTCQGRQCKGGQNSCECAQDADCLTKNDKDLCNGGLYCDLSSNTCQVDPLTVVDCSLVAHGTCEDVACSPETGACLTVPASEGGLCDDGDPCTETKCLTGSCVATQQLCECQVSADCPDDGNLCNGVAFCDKTDLPYVCKINATSVVSCPASDDVCLQASCNPKNGACSLVAVGDGKACDDGKPCTSGDLCVGGSCLGGKAICACSTQADCLAQEDGDLCNGTLFCNPKSGTCQVNPATVVQCQTVDDTDCQANQCNAKTGACSLVASLDGAVCNDNNPCTDLESCQNGACTATSTTCECQSDAECPDDANACNGTLYCDVAAGKCLLNPASVVLCEAGDNPCAPVGCVPETGACVALPLGASTVCDDGNPCTPVSTCQDGTCEPGPSTCQCQTDNDCALFASPDLCDGTLYCDKTDGTCRINSTSIVVCPTVDDTPCEVSRCQPATGICAMTNRQDGSQCDDDNPCSALDRCQSGVCSGGTSICACQDDSDCAAKEDGNLCNGLLFCNKSGDSPVCQINPASVVLCSQAEATVCADIACKPETGKCGPLHKPGTCTDDNVCTAGDNCVEAACSPGVALDCDDNDACTLDTCDAVEGCTSIASPGASCDDADACTGQDKCTGLACVGIPLYCNDNEPCTDDACVTGIGCAFVPNSDACTDNNACTTADSCLGGSCNGLQVNCTDNNACTADSCGATTGCVWTAQVAPCTDGNACTNLDTCVGQTCTGTAIGCDDGKPCTTDSCNSQVGCLYSNNNAGCSDDNMCTQTDYCAGGKCIAGATLVCNDNDQCTTDACEPDKGCVFAPGTSEPCDDGNYCTSNDVCTPGQCIGDPVGCDDGDPCTDSACDPIGGCLLAPTTAPCDDFNACTQDDTCAGGTCVSGQAVVCPPAPVCNIAQGCNPSTGQCEYLADADFVACDDLNPCTESDGCNLGLCKGVARVCDDGEPCTADSCSVATGCIYANTTAPCNDDDACTTSDTCLEGSCKGGPEADCDDSDFCTIDTCDAASGCVHTASTGPCDDSDVCNGAETCFANACLPGSALDCNDGDVCTTDSCAGTTGCDHANNTASCSDGNACTTGESCLNGSCGVGFATNCNDSNVCTDDSCDMATGCTATNNTASCSDGNACTTSDTCVAGGCVGGSAPDCDDNNPCTTDSCDLANGCTATANTEPCSDGSACTTSDTCADGVCVGGAAPNCDDNNPCTTDGCDLATGCTATNNSASCTDDNPCTQTDTCADGQCVGANPVICVAGQCHFSATCSTGNGLCSYVNKATNTACEDNNACTGAGKCFFGICNNGTAIVCNDNNPCTSDSCVPATGCVYTNNTASCTDGNACTTGDTCADGSCVGGAATDCDDNDFCTADTCETATGCAHAATTGPCDDSDACNGAETCAANACLAGTSLNCNDSNPCTTDSCNASTGCTYTNNTAGCTDGNACTTSDTCSGGSCVGGTAPNCNDSNVCTTDSCSTSTGCVNTNNTASCDDGAECTANDTCSGGTCSGTKGITNKWMLHGDLIDSQNALNGTPIGTSHFASSNFGGLGFVFDGTNAIALPATAGNFGSGDFTLSFWFKTGYTSAEQTLLSKRTTCGGETGAWFNSSLTTSGQVGFEMHNGSSYIGFGSITGGFNNNAWHSVAVVRANSVVSVYVDGVYRDQRTLGGTINAANAMKLGTGPCASIFHGMMDDVVIHNRALSAAEVTLYHTGACVGGSCVGGPVANCDDSNPCTIDSCESENDCRFTNNTIPCSDDDACTTSDTCSGGSCVGGTAPTCNDSNPCTTDSCNTSTGCVYTANTNGCNDSNACTTGDTCSGGSCVGGAAPNCDDSNPCTTDSCNTSTGCTYTNNTVSCNDGNACTATDTCSAGSCAGSTISCDDLDSGTTDSCAPVSGCVYSSVEVCDGLDNNLNGTTDDVSCNGACTCGADGVATCPSGCTACPDPGDLAQLIDDGGTAKVICAHNYPAWGVTPVSTTSLTDNSNGTITDSRTGLQWQKTASASTYTQAQARTFCDGLTLASHGDWRLPTVVEMESIVDWSASGSVFMSSIFGTMSGTTFVTTSNYYNPVIDVFAVDTSGWIGQYDYGALGNMHCVRSTGAAVPTRVATAGRFALQPGNTTVLDKVSGLVWQRSAAAGTHTYAAADSACTSNSAGLSGTGWRLPTIRELRTLTEHFRPTTPQMNATIFQDADTSMFWSSTARTSLPTYHWVAKVAGQYFVNSDSDTSSNRYRCVRSN